MREIITRVFFGLVYIFLLLFAISYSKNTFLILFGVFLIVSVYEFCKLIRLDNVIPILIAFFGYIFFICFDTGSNADDLLLSAVTLFVSVKLILIVFGYQKLQLDTSSKYLYLLGYIIFPIIILTKIPFDNFVYKPEIITGVFVLIWTNDTFAYIVGRSIGKRKLLEKVSPNKTIEGFLGGILFTVLFGIIIAYYIDQPLYIWVITAIITSVLGTIGDLIESKFKRKANVKDSGKIMPGHGGMLDRLDSIIFASPFVFLFHLILRHVS